MEASCRIDKKNVIESRIIPAVDIYVDQIFGFQSKKFDYYVIVSSENTLTIQFNLINFCPTNKKVNDW